MFQLFKFLFCNSNHYFVRLQCKYVAEVKTNTEHTNEPLNSHKQSTYKLYFIFFFTCPLSPPSVSVIIFPTYAPVLLGAAHPGCPSLKTLQAHAGGNSSIGFSITVFHLAWNPVWTSPGDSFHCCWAQLNGLGRKCLALY